MAKQALTYNTVTGNWELTETNQGKTYTNTLLTNNKNISGDIKINITAKTGTAGTPVAEKGAVSGNKVVITPKVTNAEGYIATGTITGTAIEVTAAELVSGTKTISASGVQDCKTYASVSVQEATPSFTGGVASITNPTSSYTTNMIEDSNSTYYVNVSASAKATRTAVTYDGAVAGWVSKSNGANASSANTSGETQVANSTISIKELVLPTATTSMSSTDYPTSARVETLGRSVSIRYILIPEGYHPAKQYYQISDVATSSWTGPTTAIPTTPGTQKTVTAGSEDQYIVIPAGYEAARSVKINALTVYDGSYLM